MRVDAPERASVTALPELERLPRFPVPGVLLARRAVDARVQGQGLDRHLFEEALGLTLQLAAAGPVGFRLLVTDAIDADAARFYERIKCVMRHAPRRDRKKCAARWPGRRRLPS